MGFLHQQLKARRKALGLRQQDMGVRIGMPRQQYQRLEAQGNPRLDTLSLVAKGLNSELMLIPREKIAAVKAILDGKELPMHGSGASDDSKDTSSLSDDPWAGLLGEDE